MMKLGELVGVIYRPLGNLPGVELIICPDGEEWSWIHTNSNSPLLERFFDLEVDTIDTEDEAIRLWVSSPMDIKGEIEEEEKDDE